MKEKIAEFHKNFFKSDSSRIVQRLVRTGNYNAFRDLLVKHNRKLEEKKIEALWVICCHKLNIPATTNRYI
ncbi:MAG: hypothetical protein GY863_21580 [bacterium]|nr:hypothetical protein [bacterium]